MRSCDNCILKKRGECFGKIQICSDYKYSPSMTEEQKKAWPTKMRYGDGERFAEAMNEYRLTPKTNTQAKNKKKKPNVSKKSTSTESAKYKKCYNVPISTRNTLMAFNEKSRYLYEFIKGHQQDVVILCHGEGVTKYQRGFYKVALISKMTMGYMEKEVWGDRERSILLGVSNAIDRIVRPVKIYLFISTDRNIFEQRNNKNEDLYKEIERRVKEKECKLEVNVLANVQGEIRELIRDRGKYFPIIKNLS